jgi:hypothetical protein
MADVRAGRFDVVVLWEPSRGDRRLTGWSTFLDECRTRSMKVHITSHRHTYELANPREWRTLAEDGVDSAWESEKTSLRIRRDMADAAERGIPHGRLAYGFVRHYDSVTRDLVEQVPDPERAPVVREIIGRIASGDAICAIQRDLDARGIPGPTGGCWARSTIVRLVLEGWCYIGKRRHNGGPLLDGNWPAIVGEDVYWRAVAVLSDPARKKQADKRGGIKPGGAKWLCSYIGTCAKCGAGLAVQHRLRGGQKEPQYRCSSSRGGCAVIPVEFMDRIVTETVVAFCARRDVFQGIMVGDDEQAQRYRDEAASERARLGGFEADAIAGRISSDSFARIAAGIEARAAELEAMAQDNVPPALRDLLAGGSRKSAIRRVWRGMPLTARRRVVLALFTGPDCYLRLRPSGPSGRAHGDAVLDPARIEMRLPLGVTPWSPGPS